MRPWQRPEGRWRVPDPVGADGVAGRRTTESNVPGVAFPAAPGPYRLKSGQPPVRPSTALRVSANRSAQPDRPTSFGHSRRVDRLLGTKNVAHDAPLYCGLGQGCRAESAPTPYWLPHRFRRRFRARSGRRGTPPGPVRRLRGMRRQCPPAHCVQCSGPTHAAPMEALSRRPDNSARPGARPHGRSTRGARPAGSGAAFRQVRRATGSSRRARSPSASCPPAVRLALPSRPSRPPTSPPSRRTPSTVRPRPSATVRTGNNPAIRTSAP